MGIFKDNQLNFNRVMWEVHKPLSPPKRFQKSVKARKINDLRAFSFLNISKIFRKYQTIGDLFGYPKI